MVKPENYLSIFSTLKPLYMLLECWSFPFSAVLQNPCDFFPPFYVQNSFFFFLNTQLCPIFIPFQSTFWYWDKHHSTIQPLPCSIVGTVFLYLTLCIQIAQSLSTLTLSWSKQYIMRYFRSENNYKRGMYCSHPLGPSALKPEGAPWPCLQWRRSPRRECWWPSHQSCWCTARPDGRCPLLRWRSPSAMAGSSSGKARLQDCSTT